VEGGKSGLPRFRKGPLATLPMPPISTEKSFCSEHRGKREDVKCFLHFFREKGRKKEPTLKPVHRRGEREREEGQPPDYQHDLLRGRRGLVNQDQEGKKEEGREKGP